MNGYLILEDGTVYSGTYHGAEKEILCEVVFTTTMTGYQETVTDPSFEGQAVVMTYPMIGNYGANSVDVESGRPWLSALIVRELAPFPSNYRSEEGFGSFLDRHGITVLSGIDTRALTRKLRDSGTMNGLITFRKPVDAGSRLAEIKDYRVRHSVIRVSRAHPERFGEGERKISLIDFGAKRNIVESLVARGCAVTVWPWDTPAYVILDSEPDGIMLSNGPGDPKDCASVLRHVRELVDSGVPVFSICLGHQLLALAAGFDTERLKFGHRGANHPVKDLKTGRVYMSSQNHGYCVRPDSVDPAVAEISHINVNDGSVEGLRFVGKSVFSVQFHPEASPGPRETGYLFDEFIPMVDARKEAL
ncbi:MAG TPA: carbamoyl phosphate synthase small subunit [Treponemataceae bacterium]|nr:carbamoyl phosphate synthase small subunit [Treponemataceae bacterium]